MPESGPQPGEPRRSLYKTSGGGGQGGTYVFTDLDHLDTMITRWTSIRDRVRANGVAIKNAADMVVPPAKDDPSVQQARTYINSLLAARDHNEKIVIYATGYVDKLQAARNQYATTEQGNTDRMNSVDNS